MEFAAVNWPAVALGTFAAFALGMAWFSPKMFGTSWAEGSHNLQPPTAPPIPAMVVQFLGTFMLALVVGMTAATDALLTAICAILAVALFVAGMDLFSQKSGRATMVDAGYILVSGVVMIVVQGIL
jgi:hypothetical protein